LNHTDNTAVGITLRERISTTDSMGLDGPKGVAGRRMASISRIKSPSRLASPDKDRPFWLAKPRTPSGSSSSAGIEAPAAMTGISGFPFLRQLSIARRVGASNGLDWT
jgi:hypothetical protein